MDQEWKIEFIKIKNFKSYKKTTYIGPFSYFTGIFGKNGSGKSNIIDGIIFALGEKVFKLKKTSFKSINSGFGKSSKYLESKVAIIFTKKKKIFEISRTIDNLECSSYFIEGIKVSLNFYHSIVKRLSCSLSEMIILRNPIKSKLFLDPLFLSDFIDRISGSRDLNLLHLKTSILKKKLQENCSFLFYKLQFITKKKKLFLKKQEDLIQIRKTRAKFKIWNFIKSKKKIFKYSQKMWKFSRKLQKTARKFKEIGKKEKFTRFLLSWDKKNFEAGNKRNLKIQETLKGLYFCEKFQKKLNLSISEIISKFIEKNFREFFYFIRKKIVTNKKNLLSIFLNREEMDWKSWLFLKSKRRYSRKKPHLFSFLSEILFQEIALIKKQILILRKSKKKISTLFILENITRVSKKSRENLNFFRIKNLFFFSQSKRFFFKIFHFSIRLIFILTGQKNRILNKTPVRNVKKIKRVLSNLNSEVLGIRGIISDLFKPLDSRFRLLLTEASKVNRDIILVDNQNSVKRCLRFLKEKKKGLYSFLPINYFSEKSFSKKIGINENFLDFDFYDFRGVQFAFKQTQSFFKSKTSLGRYTELDQSSEKKAKEIVIIKKEHERIEYNPLRIESNIYSNRDFSILGFQTKNFKKLFGQKIYKEKNKEKYFFMESKESFKKIQRNRFIKKVSFFSFFKSLKYFVINLEIQFKMIGLVKNRIKDTLYYLLFAQKLKVPEKDKYSGIVFPKKKVYDQIKSQEELKEFFSFILNLFFEKIKNFQAKRIWPEKQCLLSSLFQKINIKELTLLVISRKKIFLKIKTFSILSDSMKNFLSENNYTMYSTSFKTPFPEKFLSFLLFHFRSKGNETFLYKKYLSSFRNNIRRHFLNFGGFFFYPKIEKPFGTRGLKNLFFDFFSIIQETRGMPKRKISSQYFFSENFDNSLFLQSKFCRNKQRTKLIEFRSDFIQKELKKNRYRYYLVNTKFFKISGERKARFLTCIQELSILINDLYKELTTSISHPLGGAAFFNISNNRYPFFGKVLYSIIPPLKKINEIENLSGGEKTIASFVLIFCLWMKVSAPFIFFDEIDSNLDNLNSKKLFSVTQKWSGKKSNKIGIISFKIRFFYFFGTILYLFLNNKGTNLITINPGSNFG